MYPPQNSPPVELAAADVNAALELPGQQVSDGRLPSCLDAGYQPDAVGHRQDPGEVRAGTECRYSPASSQHLLMLDILSGPLAREHSIYGRLRAHGV
jgi:hypothetical protein